MAVGSLTDGGSAVCSTCACLASATRHHHLSLSRFNHRLLRSQPYPEVVQGTAEFHDQITDALLPQTDAVFHDATALDTAVDVLDPSSAIVQGLVGSYLLLCAVLAARCLAPRLTTVCDPTPHICEHCIMEEVMAMPSGASHAPESLQPHGPRAAPADDNASAVLERYLRDVRRFPLLSHTRERALGEHIQESRQQWRHLLLEHLVHVPLVLAWWPRLRRGALPFTTVCRPGPPPTADALQTALQGLHSLAGQMRRVAQQQDTHQLRTMLALRATMRALLQDWEWHPEFLQQAWRRFDRAMTLATTTRQSRWALAYVATLGYSLAELCSLWRDLSRLSSLAEQAKQEMVLHNLRLVVRVAGMLRPPGIPLSDLIQEGNLGLMRAVDSFDYRRNLKFSTLID
jgi:Sigma-70 region 2